MLERGAVILAAGGFGGATCGEESSVKSSPSPVPWTAMSAAAAPTRGSAGSEGLRMSSLLFVRGFEFWNLALSLLVVT